ncbi:MAG: choice-of-anchor Q domain-containing protein, partial [Anaerolineales bacterium]
SNLFSNSGRSGGALAISPNAFVNITRGAGQMTFTGNDAILNGGAIYNQGGVMTVQGALFHANTVPTNTVGGTNGGAIYSDARLTIRDTTFELNSAKSGGALSAEQAILTDTIFLSNTANNEGGGANISNSGALIKRGLFQNNRCTDVNGCAGGALYVEGSATLTGTRFLGNSSQYAGGAISAVGNIALTNGLVESNHCERDFCIGGALFTEGGIFLTDTLVLSNTSHADGGAASADGPIIVTGGRFQSNTCLEAGCIGGGLSGASSVTLANALILSNTSSTNGGGAYANGRAVVTGSLFQNNQCLASNCRGGGLYARGALTLADTAFLSNTTPHQGGGIYAEAALTATRGVFEGNQGGSGGGLFANGFLALTGTQFVANSSAGSGGGLFSIAGAGSVVNTLFARNTAAGRGAAIYIDSSTLGLAHNTLVGVSQPGAAAIDVQSGTVVLTNTIFASYTVGISRTLGAVVEDYSLFFNTPTHTAGGVVSGGHSFSGNPAFAGPAQDDYHLRAGSAAIDHGLDAGITVDVDGDPRPLDAGFDIGFDEFALRVLYLPLVRR